MSGKHFISPSPLTTELFVKSTLLVVKLCPHGFGLLQLGCTGEQLEPVGYVSNKNNTVWM